MSFGAGALALLVFLAPLQELDETRLDDVTGMGLVGVLFLVLLVLLGYQIHERLQGSMPSRVQNLSFLSPNSTRKLQCDLVWKPEISSRDLQHLSAHGVNIDDCLAAERKEGKKRDVLCFVNAKLPEELGYEG